MNQATDHRATKTDSRSPNYRAAGGSQAAGRPLLDVWGRALVGALLVGIGIAFGSVVGHPSTAQGEVRTPSVPHQFKSGGQLSLPVLREISATLRQIDARLARLEAAAKNLHKRRATEPIQ